MLETKICGISTPLAIDAAAEAGARYIGFIFFEKSPRHVTALQAGALAKRIPDHIAKVAVTVNADDAYLDEIVEALNPDILQLHGSESPTRVAAVKTRYNKPVMKAFAIKSADDFNKLSDFQGIADRFLFDAKPPAGSDLPGGNGVSFDWTLLKSLATDTPYMLSGGLNIGNLAEAVSQSGATAIDISSGVEEQPGIKNIEKIRELLALAAKFTV